MKIRYFMLWGLLLFFTTQAKAQWTVVDPSNLAQSIVNTTRNVVQTSTTAQNMIANCAPIKVI